MGTRAELQELLVDVLGSNNVYFQPPSTVKMLYPCIVYERSYGNTKFADNNPYIHSKRYTVTVIAADPDNVIIDKMAMLQSCVFDRQFSADGLYHDVFSIYF